MATNADYGIEGFQFPRGWFVVAEASELGDAPLPLRFFGRDFALYRGKSGRVVMLDAYCSHMGTHLAGAGSASMAIEGEQIEGDSIRCPYHGWRFDPDGVCDDIPYHEGPCPKNANLKSYPVREVMGCIMMWHDPEDGEPDYGPPQLPEWDDPQWVRWGPLDHLGRLDIHPIEILDNMADARHLGPTHGAPCEYFENEWQGHVYIQRQGGFHKGYNSMLRSRTWYTGPGVLLSRQVFGEVKTIELIANTPVDEGTVQVWHGALYQAPGAEATEADKAAQLEVQAGALQAFSSDFEIWKNKRPATRILGVPEDGRFGKGRSWYKQFFAPRARVSEMHARLDGTVHLGDLPPPPAEHVEFEATF
jgi:3-ketosteroid 9alpha-monooxygenase subunit A